jgi:hypothetical protein
VVAAVAVQVKVVVAAVAVQGKVVDKVKAAVVVQGKVVDAVVDKVKVVDEVWDAVGAPLAPSVNVSVPTAARLPHISKVYLVLK